MREKKLFVSVILILVLVVPIKLGVAVEDGLGGNKASAFVGQDLHLAGGELLSYQLSTGEHGLVLRDGFSMSIGANQFSSDSAVVWLKAERAEFRGLVRIDVNVRVYLEGKVSLNRAKGAKTTGLSERVVERGESMVVRFGVSGEVFVRADKREFGDPRGLELYSRALVAVVSVEPELGLQPEAQVPELPAEKISPEKPPKEVVTVKPGEVVPKPEEKKPRFRYPVNISPVGEAPLKTESAKAADGTDIATVLQRFYVWQKQDEEGGLLELQADRAVIFYSSEQIRAPVTSDEGKNGGGGVEEILGRGAVKAIYMSGDVVVTEGQRTIRAEEMYYDFESKKGLAIGAVMRNFDAARGIPIYVRAAKLQQIAENKFAADNFTLSSSEFHVPQLSLNASSVIITDTTPVDERLGRVSDSSYDAEMRDVRLKMGDTTIFYWPFLRSNMQRPDVPLKGAHIGHDSTWGTSVETRWYLARLLGLQEAEGTDSTLALDYYGKRGVGTGVEIDYEREDYFGKLLGYVIRDRGEDRLGRYSSRRDVEPPRELRGRFRWQHRHFLPYNWQLSSGVSYSSDERFVESYYRNEFNVGERQETYLHVKRLQDNWALSFLGKGRINDFADELEELPGAEFHVTGQSLFNDTFTLYSDTEISRLRQRIGDEHTTAINGEQFSFISQRVELDMPIYSSAFKVIPFVAGTFGYDDRSGFRRSLVDGSNVGSFGEDKVLLGEAGLRVSSQHWKVYPNVQSRLWDLNQLRHIVKPRLTAVLYEENDSVVEQHDTVNVGISQRLQTKRGPADNRRTVDWMRLDTDFTWVSDSESADSAGPDRFIWNKPIVPLRVLSAPDIFSGDLESGLHRFEMFGPRRDYFSADYVWRLSDTSALLSDMHFDTQSGVVQQYNVGFSHLRWPNLSYYIGSRYLRRMEVLDEKGSNAFTFAATYVLDPRYTLVFSQQYDFDYGASIRSDITLMRRYHRLYWSITYSADESLDRHSIVFGIWPQGIPEMAIGPRRYVGGGGYD
ncbi:MAG: hypothetical protein ACYS30_06820 [Planctomycetota bacterium]|jgi:hypothetical protein